MFVAREAGWAVRLLRPGPTADPTPPGQGQLLLSLQGRAVVDEIGGDAGKVVMTQRADQRGELRPGVLRRVPNDARWRLTSDDGAIVLAIGTSVPRETHRQEDVLALARRRRHMGPRLLFENEVVRVEFSVARGRLPGRGWVPWTHEAPDLELAFVLAGAFVARTWEDGSPQRTPLPTGSMLAVPAGVPHRFSAGGPGVCVGLIVSGRMGRIDGSPDRRALKGAFTPFSR